MTDDLYESVINRFQFLQGTYNSKKAQRETVLHEIEGLKETKDVLTKAEKVLKHLIDKLAKKDLSKMDKLITYGLNTVFPDRNIEFRSELQERGKKIWIDLQTFYNNNQTDPDSKSSVTVIESFLLRLLCIMKLKRAPLLLMDETFAAVDNGYIDNVSRLVSQLANKLKLDILLVTHNPGFAETEHTAYKIALKNNKVTAEKLK